MKTLSVYRMRIARLALTLAIALGAVALVGCGGGASGMIVHLGCRQGLAILGRDASGLPVHAGHVGQRHAHGGDDEKHIHQIDAHGKESAASQTLRQNVEAACDAVADEYALSPREREILHYLGRGYGPRYLATILPIKENTIRSHVRNIYAKTDVHTQAELLVLIDAHA